MLGTFGPLCLFSAVHLLPNHLNRPPSLPSHSLEGGLGSLSCCGSRAGSMCMGKHPLAITPPPCLKVEPACRDQLFTFSPSHKDMAGGARNLKFCTDHTKAQMSAGLSLHYLCFLAQTCSYLAINASSRSPFWTLDDATATRTLCAINLAFKTLSGDLMELRSRVCNLK